MHKKVISALSFITVFALFGVAIYCIFNGPSVEHVQADTQSKEEFVKKENIYVDIKGAINNPGVYLMNSDSRIIDVIKEAGDLTEQADTSVLNLSKKVTDEMYIIDQHAAHERIMYEKIKKNYYSNGEKEAQMLLLPDVITLTHKEMDIARENIDIFKNAGFELEEFGENTIKLNGVPTVCYDLDTKELFLETLDEINTVARTAKQEIEERFIETVACKAAVKAKMSLNVREVESLMDELLKLPNPFTCPHGRPTAIKMDLKDIEKKFARRK